MSRLQPSLAIRIHPGIPAMVAGRVPVDGAAPLSTLPDGVYSQQLPPRVDMTELFASSALEL